MGPTDTRCLLTEQEAIIQRPIGQKSAHRETDRECARSLEQQTPPTLATLSGPRVRRERRWVQSATLNDG